jgi:hypothetical protein
MFQEPLCPSSGAREYYTSGCCLLYSVIGFQVVGIVWSWGLCVRFAGCSFTGIRSAIKTHLLHLVGILFPHIPFIKVCLFEVTEDTLLPQHNWRVSAAQTLAQRVRQLRPMCIRTVKSWTQSQTIKQHKHRDVVVDVDPLCADIGTEFSVSRIESQTSFHSCCFLLYICSCMMHMVAALAPFILGHWSELWR